MTGLPTLLNSKQVQQLLGVSRPALYEMIRAGQINAIKVRSRWRFLPDEVKAIMKYTANGDNVRFL